MMHTFCICLCVYLSGVIAEEEEYYHPDIGRSIDSILKINRAELYPKYWAEEAAIGIKAYEDRVGRNEPTAKNLILFLGDGMSIPTVTAARILFGQLQNRTGEEAQLSFETFPTIGLAKTYCVNEQVPDSACTATAYLCGVKSNFGTLGVTARVARHNCTATLDKSTHLESIAAWALAEGKDVGIVTTARVTHASPAGSYAKIANRYWENDAEVRKAGHSPELCPDIAHQLVHGEPGNKFKVIFGGGRQEFTPTSGIGENGGKGTRTDGRNLIKEWIKQKRDRNQTCRFVYNRDTLNEALKGNPEFLLGLFGNNHMSYAKMAPETQPTLAEMTEAAIKLLSRNERGFFLFVEGGRIDHAHHDNQPRLALSETLELAAAVAAARDLLAASAARAASDPLAVSDPLAASSPRALLVVTADHGHVMSLNGYSGRGSDVRGLAERRDRHRQPYMKLSYTTGPGFRAQNNGTRQNISTEENFYTEEFTTHADVPLQAETHGGEDVGVWAWGAQHAAFAGGYEQSRIPRLMAYVGCIGPGPRAPACPRAQSRAADSRASVTHCPHAAAAAAVTVALAILNLTKLLL